MPTLAVAGNGAIVPLIEGHSATRERWTANLTTFSNEERLKEEGPPYCEIMCKATAEGPLEKRLREYIRSRGYGPWVSVTTSEKDSYRQADVLAFLERHLPKVDEHQPRRWRIIMADDFSAHLSPAIFNVCWSRRYVFIPHDGGVTPVAQTPDTDLKENSRALVPLPKPMHWRSRKHSSACSRRPWRPSRKWERRDLLRSCRTQ